MEKIHNLKKRQPLMLTKDNAKNWLNPNLTENDVKELMQPLNESFMQAHTIKKISPKTVDIFSADIKKEFEYPELALYDM